MAEDMTGVELLQGDSLLFRGGVLVLADEYWLYNEDGTLENLGFAIDVGNGIITDENGNIIDPVEPSASAILDLMNKPPLTQSQGT